MLMHRYPYFLIVIICSVIKLNEKLARLLSAAKETAPEKSDFILIPFVFPALRVIVSLVQ